MTQTTPATPAPMYRIVVLELDDVVDRIRPDRPNLYVGLSTRSADQVARGLRAGRGRPQWAQGRVVAVRADLVPADVPLEGVDDREQADVWRDRLIRRLRRQGYTVNMNTTIHRTYVINLHNPDLADVGAGYVYVGETSKPLEQRLQEHLTGAPSTKGGRLASRVVQRFGRDINWELTPRRLYHDQRASKRAERRLAERLRADGYVVEGGH